ncbi:aminotransferase class III-fold pyridoxal phosphate-dependent enzyme [Candidatus Roizmanbacteria bacterium]|nr:aminotransferase class III-fold pyridoxal phosphate-dependent enzyme [Candidatus Roizmanbacteria bacterium]
MNFKTELALIEKVSQKALDRVLKKFATYTRNTLVLNQDQEKVIKNEFTLLKKSFTQHLLLSLKLAHEADEGKRRQKKRIAYLNIQMSQYRKQIRSVFPRAGLVWVLDGIIFKNQIAGIKKLAGLPDEDGAVIDVLNSASSVSLGAENPWLIMADRVEDHLGIRDNICSAYHTGLRQGFVLKSLAELYPGNKKQALTVHTESSGTIVDSIAIESCVAYAEKTFGGNTSRRILAVDGTWAGGYGSAREGTGFGIDKQQVSRIGKNVWVDRCLPPPIKENGAQFLSILKNKIKTGEIAGVYLEPDSIGDLGIIIPDKNILKRMIELLMQYGIPVIADCVQQLGRTGGYWGENVEKILNRHPLLVVTTAKSASNGQPFGYVIMPKIIADAAYALTQVTTNQMNGPLLRALVVAEILRDSLIQKWLIQKGEDLEQIALSYGLESGEKGLRGKFMNRGIYVGDNEKVKLVQIALLVEDGILVGALPQSIRYQPMLLDFSETNSLVAHIICRRVLKVLAGDISQEIKDIYKTMQGVASGLARKNT